LRRLVGRRVERAFRTDDGGLDLTAFKACLKDNGVTAPNVDMEATAQSVVSACAPD